MFGRHVGKQHNRPTMTVFIYATMVGTAAGTMFSKMGLLSVNQLLRNMVAETFAKHIAYQMVTPTQNIRILNLIRILLKKEIKTGLKDTFLM